MKHLLMACFILISFFASAQKSQFSKTKNRFSGGFELGPGEPPELYRQLFFTLQRGTNYYRFKNANLRDVQLWGQDRPRARTLEYALIIGKSYTLGRLHNFQFGTGVALAGQIVLGEYIDRQLDDGFYHNHYRKIQKNTIGLPLEVKYNFLLSKTIGLSLAAEANVNSVRSFFSPAAGITVGILRDK